MPCRTALPCLLLALLSTAASAECDEPKGQYRGKLFDAMAQIEGGMAGRVEEAINKAGVQRIALFGREKLGRRTRRDGPGRPPAGARHSRRAQVLCRFVGL
ncbi:hypothetical protein ACFONG_15630 [Uliginosibacterium paludis]|uniref:Uncharacterized protein n=1 Tax=Uliginosibacterium paludis TaxID=1615952 RepID=A0ABV2CU36_9RHOO